jgi:hypothetical protein
MTAAGSVACLKITLDDVEPAVLRRLEVPLGLRLDRLHLVIQTAMGWTDTHLYEIRVGDLGWGIPDPDWDYGSAPLDARKATLLDAIEDTGAKTLEYLYDFGDGWAHTIRIERIDGADPAVSYPRLLEAVGRCPPEDVGGAPGYEELLEALADPDHERHAELHEWLGDDFDPHAVDVAGISQALLKLGGRWQRGTRSKPRRATQ